MNFQDSTKEEVESAWLAIPTVVRNSLVESVEDALWRVVEIGSGERRGTITLSKVATEFVKLIASTAVMVITDDVQKRDCGSPDGARTDRGREIQSMNRNFSSSLRHAEPSDPVAITALGLLAVRCYAIESLARALDLGPVSIMKLVMDLQERGLICVGPKNGQVCAKILDLGRWYLRLKCSEAA